MVSQQDVERIGQEARGEITAVASLAALEQVRLAYLGRQGRLTAILRSLGRLPPELRPTLGQAANSLRQELEAAVAARRGELEQQEAAQRGAEEVLDVTLPGRSPALGHLHPITLVTQELQAIFVGMGFEVVDSPEVETYEYNFGALNYPPDHPALDEQDSFYLDDQVLLRTQTSTAQVRQLRQRCPQPLRIVHAGRCYRRENVTATHFFTFYQIEALAVDEGISFADLKGTLGMFVQQLFGPATQVRLRADFFPFTEPSGDYSINCELCGGAGCRLCKGTGWVELGGCGLVHPNVLRDGGYDPEQVSGFAFGLGIDRIVQRRYGIEHIRALYESDMRFLKQF